MHCPFCSHRRRRSTIRAWLQRAIRFAVVGSVWLAVSGLPRLSLQSSLCRGSLSAMASESRLTKKTPFGTHAGAGKKASQRGKVGKRDGSY